MEAENGSFGRIKENEGVFVGDRREIEDGLFEEQFEEYQIRAGGRVAERKFATLQRPMILLLAFCCIS